MATSAVGLLVDASLAHLFVCVTDCLIRLVSEMKREIRAVFLRRANLGLRRPPLTFLSSQLLIPPVSGV